MGTGFYPGVKRSGRGVDHLPPHSAEVEERIELWAFPACCRVNNTFTVALEFRLSVAGSLHNIPFLFIVSGRVVSV